MTTPEPAVPGPAVPGPVAPGPRVVVIGAGVVGAALADELAARGLSSVTVLERGPLPAPGGSSSHAPGLVFQANPAKTMTEFARYTVAKLSGLSWAGRPGLRQVGGLEVATTPARLADLHRRAGWLASWGVDAEVVSGQDCVRLFPLLDQDRVLGGLHVPSDGAADAVAAVAAQLERARSRGVRVLDRTEVIDVRTAGDRVTGVLTAAGDHLPADIVVCCAGIWGPKVAALAGTALPLTPLAHQLAWTGPVPGLTAGTEINLPVLRHQQGDLYYRQRVDRLAIGFYGHRPMPVEVADLPAPGIDADADADPGAPMPSVLPFTEDDFVPAWTETGLLLPATLDAKIESGINGLFSFTTDDLPLIGESAAVRGFWVAEAVWVTHSAGVARAVAESIIDGYSTSFDLHECDLNRFQPHQLAPAYVRERSCRNFVEVYDIKHPLEPMREPRPIRTSPFHHRQQDLGGYFLEAAGWERAQWYEANAGLLAADPAEVPRPDAWGARYWSPIVAAEARHTRRAVAAYDMTPLPRLAVTGPGAADFLDRMTTGRVSRPVGTVTYCLLLGPDGGVRSDITVARLGEREFQIGSNGPYDTDLLTRQLPGDGTVRVREVTAGTCCIGLWGPKARDVLAPLTDLDLSDAGLRYFRCARGHVGVVPVTLLRVSYVGELGWEIYTTADLGAALWDAIWAAGDPHGLIAAGRGAFTSLRLEKGYRAFGTDLTFEHDPYEAGIGFAVATDKPGFVGRDAVLRRRDHVRRRLTCLTLDLPVDGPVDATVPLGREPVYHRDTRVGYVTSASWGHTIGRGIAYAWLPTELTAVGTRVRIRYFDRDLPARVSAEPLVATPRTGGR